MTGPGQVKADERHAHEREPVDAAPAPSASRDARTKPPDGRAQPLIWFVAK